MISDSPRGSMDVSMAMQESGIITTSGTQFGPATQDHYDLSKWAMTVPDATETEVFDDPPESERDREDNEPVFMKPLLDHSALPSLITILGNIPLARDVLSTLGETQEDYGDEPNWWTGTPVPSTRVVDVDSPMVEPSDASKLTTEIHRLFAFMHGSNRLYGSVAPLQSLYEAQQEASDQDPDNSASAFLEYFTKAMESQLGMEEASKLFKTVIQPVQSPMTQINIPLNRGVDHDVLDLYDAVDALLWRSDADGSQQDSEDLYLDDVAPILAIQITSTKNSPEGLQLSLPLRFYIDRYLEKNRALAKNMRARAWQVKDQLAKLDAREKELEQHKSTSKGDSYSSLKLVGDTTNFLNATPVHFPDDPESDDSDMEHEVHPGTAHRLGLLFEDIREKSEGMCQSMFMNNSLADLAPELRQGKEALRAKLDSLRSTLKMPTHTTPEEHSPMYGYQLRGLAVRHGLTYVLRPSESGGQWWKFEYGLPIGHVEVNVQEVEAAASNAKGPLFVVYASDDACEPRPFSFSQPAKV
jgi:hypothetical protein